MESSLVFCIFLGILRHKFRVPTRHTLKNFFFGFILKMDRKERNFGQAFSVNLEFLIFSGVQIATCAQKGSPYSNVEKNAFHYALLTIVFFE